MDSAKDCNIELINTVCCKEYDPLAIFQLAEEYRDKAVANQILRYSFLEKDIRFIQEKNSVLITGDLEDARELYLELGCIDRQFAGGNLTVRPGLGDARQQNIPNKGVVSGAQLLPLLLRSFQVRTGHFRILVQSI
jgi:hypothetical protein